MLGSSGAPTLPAPPPPPPAYGETYTEGIEAPAGYRGTDAVKRYAAQDDFYKKPHLSRYNNLFK